MKILCTHVTQFHSYHHVIDAFLDAKWIKNMPEQSHGMFLNPECCYEDSL